MVLVSWPIGLQARDCIGKDGPWKTPNTIQCPGCRAGYTPTGGGDGHLLLLIPVGEKNSMCRLFALRASRPGPARGPLCSDPHALVRQSLCDRRSQTHDSGWGIGYYAGDQVCRARSALPAADDPSYRELAETVVSH